MLDGVLFYSSSFHPGVTYPVVSNHPNKHGHQMRLVWKKTQPFNAPPPAEQTTTGEVRHFFGAKCFVIFTFFIDGSNGKYNYLTFIQ